MIQWLKRSFIRLFTITIFIILTTFISINTYLNYEKNSSSLQEQIMKDVNQHAQALAIGSRDDIQFKHYYNIWERLHNEKS
jgi:hypothetical protein